MNLEWSLPESSLGVLRGNLLVFMVFHLCTISWNVSKLKLWGKRQTCKLFFITFVLGYFLQINTHTLSLTHNTCDTTLRKKATEALSYSQLLAVLTIIWFLPHHTLQHDILMGATFHQFRQHPVNKFTWRHLCAPSNMLLEALIAVLFTSPTPCQKTAMTIHNLWPKHLNNFICLISLFRIIVSHFISVVFTRNT